MTTALQTQATEIVTTYWACVGTDGVRPVVWGLGDSPEAARSDASAQEIEPDDLDDMSCHRITAAQRAIVEAGDISWPVRS